MEPKAKAPDLSQERFDPTAHGDSVGLWHWPDVSRTEEQWSPIFYALLGYEEGEIEASLTTFEELLHPDDREPTFALLNAHFRRESPFDVEYRLRHKSGTYRWFRSIGQASWDDTGNPVGVVGTIQDVHDQKLADQRIGSLVANLEAVVATAVDGMIIIDSQGIIQKFNPACAHMFGYTPEEVIGQNVKMLMPESYAHEHDQYLRNYQETGEAKIIGIGREVVGRRKDGSEFPMDVSVGEMATGNGRGYVGVVRDITERKKAEEELRKLATDLQAVIATAVDGMIIIDSRGMVQEFNPACAHMFGYTPEEVIGQNVKMLMPESYAHEHDQYLRNYQETGEAKIIGIGREVVGRRKDGSEFPMDLSVGEMEIGTRRGYVGVVRDITERKRAEEDREAYTTMLKRSNEELEQFAYIASHDLQEPLRMVSNYCDLLQRRYQDKLDQDANDFIEFAISGAKRMRSLIEDLLAYSRAGREDIQFSLVDCNQVARDVVSSLSASIEETGADVQWNKLPTVSGHEGELGQLLQNLVGNAIKFHGREPPKVNIKARAKGSYWHFAVSDNGIGIEPEHAERIFRVFQRLHGRAEYAGTGIGLAICKKIVERHGGSIWIDSKSSSGTTMRFTLKKGT